ncbi:MAG: FIST N-terminal domain-containing protein, partial [Candidatus Thermoplasmatota archaeon]
AVGMTRKWDAREAGREVARNTIKDLKTPPSFIVLFSTIHYKDHGGFQEFLDGVWDVIPEGTPLIGGTVAGFMNNYGCFTHGASALAVSYPNMDISIGCGKNTKRNPQKAAISSSKSIKEDLKETSYSNKFLLNLVSGPVMPNIPGFGQKKIIKSGIISKIAIPVFDFSQLVFQKGVGREDELFESLVNLLSDYTMIMGTLVDNNKGIKNYQFFNDKILINHTVNLGFSSDLATRVHTTHGMNRTNIEFDITKISRNKRVLHEINGRPAVDEITNLLGWPDDFIDDETMYKTILYYPILVKNKDRESPVVMPFIMKDSIMIPCVFEEGRSCVLRMSGKDIINAITENLEYFNDVDPEFGIFSACATILETLGNDVYRIRDNIVRYFKEKPFIMFWAAGEASYSSNDIMNYANMSFNTAIFGK